MPRLLLPALLLSAALAATALALGGKNGPWVQLCDGQRVKTDKSARVYLVADGRLRPLDHDAYVELWSDWSNIAVVDSVAEGSIGPTLAKGTRLIRGEGQAAVWLVENAASRRHVKDLNVFGAYRFEWGRVHVVPVAEVEAIPRGADLE
jgi:hypothetical protein